MIMCFHFWIMEHGSFLFQPIWRAPKSRGETHLRVSQSQVAEIWNLEARSRFPTLERGRGSSWEPRDSTRKSDLVDQARICTKQTTEWLVHIPGHPLVLGQATGTSDHKTHHGPDSGVCHHHTPYSILCDALWGLHPNGTNSRDSQVGVPKLSRNCPGWSPGTLGAHNSRLQARIAMRSEPKL
jgi:hypothetical protein